MNRRVAARFEVALGEQGPYLAVRVDGDALLRHPLTNKDTAFTREERAALGLDGLLPPRVETLADQVARAYAGYGHAASPIARYRFLRQLQDKNEVLFYALLERHVREMMPIVYTPTVGDAIQHYSEIYDGPRGACLSCEDACSAEAALAAYASDDVRMIVATDSSAILGIGDQGWGGHGISVGKLALYTLAGAVSPYETLPVVLDVGTDRTDLHADPLYLGVRRKRLRGEEYLAFVRRFVHAVRARWPRAIVQWEDLGKDTAFTVLDTFRGELASFNDDIQGTGAVALAGLLAAARAVGRRLQDERFLVYGAGAGGIGVARAIREGLVREGLTRAEAQARVFVLDSKGLLLQSRAMEDYKRDFAQPDAVTQGWRVERAIPNLRETIANARITALLGLSGQGGAFDESVIRAVMVNSPRPLVFALSNPTNACEAVPADVIAWTNGSAIVATGSPFEPVVHGGRTYVVGQGNNAFIFPGLGFGAILTQARAITDGMIAAAAAALAEYTITRHLASGLIYPPVEELREASIHVAVEVAKRAVTDGVAERPLPDDAEAHVRAHAWTPKYLPVRRT